MASTKAMAHLQADVGARLGWSIAGGWGKTLPPPPMDMPALLYRGSYGKADILSEMTD